MLRLHRLGMLVVFIVNFLHLIHELVEQLDVLASNFVNVIFQFAQILVHFDV